MFSTPVGVEISIVNFCNTVVFLCNYLFKESIFVSESFGPAFLLQEKIVKNRIR